MIKALKRKLILIMMLSFTLAIITLLVLMVFVPESQKKNEIRHSLESLFDNTSHMNQAPPDMKMDGIFDKNTEPPEKPVEEAPPQDMMPGNEMRRDTAEALMREYGGNILRIEADSNGALLSWTSTSDSSYSDETVKIILSSIGKDTKEFDYRDGFYFVRHTTPDGSAYVCLDYSSLALNFRRTLIWALVGAVEAWILLLLLSFKLSSLLVRPVQEAFDKQTQFISDASHELKTPVAVIQANADLLMKESGENKWLDYIIQETHRMDKLVKDLLFLSNMKKTRLNMVRLNFSRLVEGAVLPYEALAYEKGRVIETSVKDDIYVKGDESELEKLISILLSNAVKYSYENTTINVSLTCQGRCALLKIRNEGIGIRKEERNRIFERFYRADSARSRDDNSYGLGLAMAETIAVNHNAKIYAESEWEKWAEFTFEIKEC